MGRRHNQRSSASFDSKLIAYQKIAVLLMLPPLISAFWGFASFASMDFSIHLQLAAARLITSLSGFSYGGAIYSAVMLAFCILIALKAARGSFPYFLIGVILYGIDAVIDTVLFFFIDLGMMSVVSIVVHILLLSAFAFGIVLYKQAEKKLREEKASTRSVK